MRIKFHNKSAKAMKSSIKLIREIVVVLSCSRDSFEVIKGGKRVKLLKKFSKRNLLKVSLRAQ